MQLFLNVKNIILSIKFKIKLLNFFFIMSNTRVKCKKNILQYFVFFFGNRIQCSEFVNNKYCYISSDFIKFVECFIITTFYGFLQKTAKDFCMGKCLTLLTHVTHVTHNLTTFQWQLKDIPYSSITVTDNESKYTNQERYFRCLSIIAHNLL